MIECKEIGGFMIFDGLAFMGCSLVLGMIWAYFG